MDKYKMLSGDEIVAKGATKLEVTLPEVGLKDVTPNGSWLEQKQIQSSLEARKHLVEVQRIEKIGVLTHAEWREDLKLAEVTQQTGGYWQFFGHHRDSRLYLRPEEALFLMEVNCLLLRYNEVIVSLQQAYSLLLSDEISIIQYKVYASLSRLGYKVFRHFPKKECCKTKKDTEPTDNCQTEMANCDKANDVTTDTSNKANLPLDAEMTEAVTCSLDNKCNVESKVSNENKMDMEEPNLSEENNSLQEHSSDAGNKYSEQKAMVVEEASAVVVNNKEIEKVEECADATKTNPNEQNAMNTEENNSSIDSNLANTVTADTISMELDENIAHCSNTQPTQQPQEELCEETSDNTSKSRISSSGLSSSVTNMDPLTKYCQWKLEKLKERRSNIRPKIDIHKSFKDCPDILENQIVTVNTPKEEYLPKNIFINNLQYVINIENVRTKNVERPACTGSTYSLSDEVNGAHIRRVTNVPAQTHRSSRSQRQPTSFPAFLPSFRPNIPLRHYNYWRPRSHMSYFQFNLFFQRPYMSNFHPRFQFYPRMHMPMFPRHSSPPIDFTVNNEFENLPNNTRKRPKDHAKITHLENLKNLAQRLKNLVSSGINRSQNLQAVQSLLNTYNARFRTRLRLSEQYEIVSDETIVDTITLDDEEDETRVKRPRLDDQPDLFLENLNKIRQTALKLKKLECENKSTARHRRAISSVIKTFNKYFDADIHMTENYDVLDRRYINLDSSSDSDCVIEEVPKVKSGKKLRNPFNILKKLSEKQVSPSSPTTSRQDIPESPIVLNTQDPQEVLQKSFKKPWLPDDNDFGRPEIISRETMTARFVETKKEDFLFDFLKDQTYKFSDWVDIKIAFLESVEETNAILHTGAMLENNIEIKSLVKSEDGTDMASVLKKLSIIKANKNISEDSILSIDYDVYNRDVKNFRKANRPTPHFRVVCIDETTACVSGIHIATLHAKTEDEVAVLFAIVGVSSISFVQMNPTDLPVYLPSNDLG